MATVYALFTGSDIERANREAVYGSEPESFAPPEVRLFASYLRAKEEFDMWVNDEKEFLEDEEVTFHEKEDYFCDLVYFNAAWIEEIEVEE